MNDFFKGLLTKILTFWGNLSRMIKTTVIVGLVSLIAVFIIVGLLSGRPEYTMLYTQLERQEVEELAQRLSEMGVSFEITNDTVYVSANDISSTRMQLAQEGYPKTGIDYDMFLNSNDITTTDYQRKQILIFELQQRLEKSIMTLSGVRRAIVTLAIPEQTSFVLESDRQQPSASIFVHLNGGVELTHGQVTGIEALVASAVLGLTPENIVIADGDGIQLNGGVAPSSDGLAESEMMYRFERMYSLQIVEMINTLLGKVLGPDNISVSARAVLNHDQKMVNSTEYTPSHDDGSGMLSHLEESDITAANYNLYPEGYPGTEENAEVPTYEDEETSPDGDYVSHTKEYDYLVNTINTQVKKFGFEVVKLTASIIVNDESMSDKRIEDITRAVANNIGTVEDNVSVTGMRFLTSEILPLEEVPVPFDIQTLLMYGIPLLLALLIPILAIILRPHKRKLVTPSGEVVEGDFNDDGSVHIDVKNKQGRHPDEESADEIIEGIENALTGEKLGDIIMQQTRETQLKEKIRDFAVANPDIVAQLLRTWMKDEDV